MRGGPLLGLLPQIRRDFLGTLECARREHGDVVRLVAGPPRMRATSYVVFHPDGVRRAMATEADRYRKDNRFYKEIRWRSATGCSTARTSAGCASGVSCNRCSRAGGSPATRTRWRRSPRSWSSGRLGRRRQDEPIDAAREMSRVTLRIVGHLLFGADGARRPGGRARVPGAGRVRAPALLQPGERPRARGRRAPTAALRAQRSLYAVRRDHRRRRATEPAATTC